MVELVIGAVGVALIGCGVGANRQWLDQHILPSFLLPRPWFVAIQTAIRLALALIGAMLVTSVRPAVGRTVRSSPGLATSVVAAVVLAALASEPLLRRIQFRPTGWLAADAEPLRRSDARLGWTLVPSHVGHARVAGRTIDYFIDANGYRVPRIDAAVDRREPTLLFTGESVMFGEGLTWDESIPGQVAALTGVHIANLAVHGYGNDQAFLRLQEELPHFQRPLAIVTLFMPALFGRNLDEERPHLAAGLVWTPPVQRWRIQSLLRLMVPYRSSSRIEQGIALTHEIFDATAALAHARGAVPLMVIPQFGAETEQDARLRQRVVTGLQMPVETIALDPAWRLAWDRHPDARAAHAIATAITRRLSEKLTPTR